MVLLPRLLDPSLKDRRERKETRLLQDGRPEVQAPARGSPRSTLIASSSHRAPASVVIVAIFGTGSGQVNLLTLGESPVELLGEGGGRPEVLGELEEAQAEPASLAAARRS